MGLPRLGGETYKESIGEMKHADILVKRILFLEGLPNLQDLHKLSIGESVPEALAADLALEQAGRTTLIGAIAASDGREGLCDARHAHAHPRRYRGHIDFLETELSVLGEIGLQNYLQSQAGPPVSGHDHRD